MAGTIDFRSRRELARTLLAVIVGVLGLAAFLGGAVFTIIQAYYSYLYLRAMLNRTSLDVAMMRVPWWSRRFMVDLALIAQALVCFTGACVAYRAWQTLTEPRLSVSQEHFPFPRRYRLYFVQLGLWGTVVGFVIGFYNLSGKSADAPKVLLTALSASLWSTLTAITLAYMLCPVTEFVFQRWLVRFNATDTDSLEALRDHASAAAAALQHLTEMSSAADTSITLHTVASQLLSVQKDLAALAGHLDVANQHLSLVEGKLSAVKDEIEDLQRSTRTSRKDLDAVESRFATLQTEVANCGKEIRGELTQLQKNLETAEQTFTTGLQQRDTQIARVIESGGALMDQLRRSFEKNERHVG